MSEKCSMEFEECENPHYQGDAREAFLRREIDLETREIAEEWQAGHDHHASEVAELREAIEYLSSAMESRADWISSLQAEVGVLRRALEKAIMADDNPPTLTEAEVEEEIEMYKAEARAELAKER